MTLFVCLWKSDVISRHLQSVHKYKTEGRNTKDMMDHYCLAKQQISYTQMALFFCFAFLVLWTCSFKRLSYLTAALAGLFFVFSLWHCLKKHSKQLLCLGRVPLIPYDRQITVHNNELQLNQHLKTISIFLL